MTMLLLGGTGEGRALAEALQARGIDAITSLAGATRDPAPVAGRVRVGGFGGEAGFREYLTAEAISAVIDATHPFADQISARTARVAGDLGLPYLQVLRPEWIAGPGDRWTHIDDETQAAAHVRAGQTLFIATGRQTLAKFAGLADCRLICRQIDPPDRPFPYGNGCYLVGRPPFSVDHEVALLRDLGVDWLITKNAGGAVPATKLTAARHLGVPVLMIRRPPQPDAERVETVAAALDWLDRLA